ncbi:MAG: YcxB family protein [Chitinophagales bacterium]
MQITFQYTPTILQRAHTLHYKKFFLFQSRLPMIMGFLAIWAGLLLFLILGKDGNRFLSASLIFSGIVAIGIYFWLMQTTGARVYKRLAEYRAPFVMTINNEAILMTIHENTYEMPWKELMKALILPDMILLYPTEKMFYIFPKENFKAGEFDAFETMVREKVAAIF